MNLVKQLNSDPDISMQHPSGHLGTLWQHNESKVIFMLCRIGAGEHRLISLETGNRFRDYGEEGMRDMVSGFTQVRGEVSITPKPD